MDTNKFYITTAIAYVNAPPHMGHAFQFIRTDAIARYHRLKNRNVFFLTGTDEYGSKIYKTARKENLAPQELADKNAVEFKKLHKLLGISYDEFIRTTDEKKHWPGAQLMWKQLTKSDDLYKEKYKGYYCSGCEAYLTGAELRGGKCVYHNTEPEYIEEENYFFRLSKYSKRLKEMIEKDELKITPASRKNEALNLIEDIKDISFSRPRKTLPWGIPVPGNSEHIMYVWCDALTNYISALGYGSDNLEKFDKFWPADIHVIGKDNLRFHALYWPAMLLSAELPLPKKIYIHGFITSEGKKMSKSIGNTVDPFKVAEKYGTDSLRYYLLKAIPATEDGDFTIEHFEEVYNADLANGLGNTLARVIAMAEKYFNGNLSNQKPHKEWTDVIKISEECVDYAMKEYDTSKALDGIWHILKKIDEEIDETKPWALFKSEILNPKSETNPKSKTQNSKLNNLLYNWLEALHNVGRLLKPFLPETADKILEQLGYNEKMGFSIKKGNSLFPRI